MGKQIG